ncbi:helix-turn-helix domain-containing protein [Nonomuraea sp. K274]|uniref:Helix-turn-helix domain-containing protein n=1 Tax=Nonomuraea cypriaca TaxID=1187855 RepID=A0A931EZR4_9ACTN|nr:helix-turn-helix domain-containing protein [Nonomuraea cypriaca]MBF8188615.1 helix-turn-helix domain-containing protein [Nonomuraea cypriaca]
MLEDLQALIDDVAERLGTPALLEDEEQRTVAYSSHTSPVDHVRQESILRRRTRPEIRDWFRKFGILTSTEPLRIPGDASVGALARLCLPVRHHGLLTGFLWLIDEGDLLGPEQVEVAVEAARHAGVLMYEELLAARLADNVVGHLLSPFDDLREEAVRQAAEAGLISPESYIVVAVLRYVDADHPRPKTQLAEGLRTLTRQFAHSEFHGIAYGDHSAVLVPARSARTASARALDVGQAARDVLIQRATEDGRDARVVLGVGDPQERPGQARTSYRQARMAADVAEVIPAQDDVGVWSRLGVYRALTQLPDAESVLDPRVGRLIREADPQVVQTVERYLDLGGDAQATARELHLSRGTLYYRLQKVEHLASIDVHDGADRLSLHVGLKLARFARRQSTGEKRRQSTSGKWQATEPPRGAAGWS